MDSLVLLLLMFKFGACALENVTEQIVKARITANDWKIIEEQQDELDLFSKKRLKEGLWDVVFKVQRHTVATFEQNKIPMEILVDDVDEMLQSSKLNRKSHERTDKLSNNTITFNDFLTYKEIQQYLHYITILSRKNKTISVESIGKTFEKRDILMVKIVHEDAENIMFFDAGIHAREWLSVMTAMYLLKQLVEVDDDPGLHKMNWFIIPCLNVDGYVYSHSSPKHRLVRKNKNNSNCPDKCKRCGVDLNRNFGYKFGVSGTSKDPCAETYGGDGPFSESESRALGDVLLKYSRQISLYLTLHSWSYLILYPWGYDKIPCDDWRDLRRAARYAVNQIPPRPEIYHYEIGSTGKDFYPAAGGSDDYAKSLGIKYCYTMEVQGGGDTGFDPDPSDIKDYVKDNYFCLAALAKYINNRPFQSSKRQSSAANVVFSQNIFVLILLLVLK